MTRVVLWLVGVVALACWIGTLLAVVSLPISVLATVVVGWLLLRRFRPGAAAEVGRIVGIVVLVAIGLALLGGDVGIPELAIGALVVAVAIWWPHRPRRLDTVHSAERSAEPQHTS
jgi:hypothetical protein